MPVALNHAAIATYRGDVYVVGGYKGSRAVAGLLRYDPEREPLDAPALDADRARRADRGRDRRPPVRRRRRGRTARRSPRSRSTTSAPRRWSPAPPMAVAREHLGGAVSGNAFYVLAGRAAGVGNMTVAERYVPSRRRWERLPGRPPAARRHGRGGARRRAHRARRRGGGRGHDQGGRALRPGATARGRSCPTCRSRATASASSRRGGACSPCRAARSRAFTSRTRSRRSAVPAR